MLTQFCLQISFNSVIIHFLLHRLFVTVWKYFHAIRTLCNRILIFRHYFLVQVQKYFECLEFILVFTLFDCNLMFIIIIIDKPCDMPVSLCCIQTLMMTCKNLLNHDLHMHLRSLRAEAVRGFLPLSEICSLCNKALPQTMDSDLIIIFRSVIFFI